MRPSNFVEFCHSCQIMLQSTLGGDLHMNDEEFHYGQISANIDLVMAEIPEIALKNVNVMVLKV